MTEEKQIDSRLAREMVIPLYGDKTLLTGETRLAHADGMANIVRGIRNDEELIAACYLFAVHDCVQSPEEWLKKHFGNHVCELVIELHRLIELNGKTRLTSVTPDPDKPADKLLIQAQDALLRKMVLAMCKDLRVVILRLASRLQTLRWFAMKKDDPEGAKVFGEDTLALYAPLANRLGIWQIKWELEDLSLRFTKPEIYNEIANQKSEQALWTTKYKEKLQKLVTLTETVMQDAQLKMDAYKREVNDLQTQISILKARLEAQPKTNPFGQQAAGGTGSATAVPGAAVTATPVKKTINLGDLYVIMEISGQDDRITAKLMNREGQTFLVRKGTKLKTGDIVSEITPTYIKTEHDGEDAYLYFASGGVMETEPDIGSAAKKAMAARGSLSGSSVSQSNPRGLVTSKGVPGVSRDMMLR